MLSAVVVFVVTCATTASTRRVLFESLDQRAAEHAAQGFQGDGRYDVQIHAHDHIAVDHKMARS